MMVVCKDRLERIKADQRLGLAAAAAVEADIAALLSGKTYEQLSSLQRQVHEKLTSGEPVDTDYWEGLLQKLLVWKAKVSLITDWRDSKANSCAGQAEESARSSSPQSPGAAAEAPA